MVFRRSPAIWLTTSLWRLSRGRAGVFQWRQGTWVHPGRYQFSVAASTEYTAAILHAGVQVMSPTATQVLRDMDTLGRYLPTQHGEVAGQRCPATWWTLHMRRTTRQNSFRLRANAP